MMRPAGVEHDCPSHCVRVVGVIPAAPDAAGRVGTDRRRSLRPAARRDGGRVPRHRPRAPGVHRYVPHRRRALSRRRPLLWCVRPHPLQQRRQRGPAPPRCARLRPLPRVCAGAGPPAGQEPPDDQGGAEDVGPVGVDGAAARLVVDEHLRRGVAKRTDAAR